MSTEHKDRRRRDAKTNKEKGKETWKSKKQRSKEAQTQLKFMEMYRTRVYELRT
jgi:hypothetical protein